MYDLGVPLFHETSICFSLFLLLIIVPVMVFNCLAPEFHKRTPWGQQICGAILTYLQGDFIAHEIPLLGVTVSCFNRIHPRFSAFQTKVDVSADVSRWLHRCGTLIQPLFDIPHDGYCIWRCMDGHPTFLWKHMEVKWGYPPVIYFLHRLFQYTHV